MFRRGGFSSRVHYRKLFLEDLRIRYDNNQNIILILIIAIYKFIKHFRKNYIMKILITGCAGFIGYHLVNSLNSKNLMIYGIDNMNDYYSLK